MLGWRSTCLCNNMNFILLSFLFLMPVLCEDAPTGEPTVFISILVRNKAHVLPYFLTLLHNLQYPKDRITLYFRSHHNSDNSLEILNQWLNKSSCQEYHKIIKDLENCSDPCLLPGEYSSVGWTPAKFHHIMNMRQNALDLARYDRRDYFWNLDSDVLLLEPSVLQDLISNNLSVVAPLLTSLGAYSNFWGAMNDDYYYARSADYNSIRKRTAVGCHEVAMVHSSQLIDLRLQESDFISFHPSQIKDYPGPDDDMIVFALSCTLNNIPMYVCNQQDYGIIMLPLEEDQNLAHDLETLRYTLLEITTRHPPIKIDESLMSYIPQIPDKTKLGLDEIYVINLERRPERRERLKYNFDLLGIDAKFISAVDGSTMSPEYIGHNKIRMLPGYSDPYHDRPLKWGEIGCFMSHYKIWEEVFTSSHDMVLILEDDIRFEPFFIEKFQRFLGELKSRRDEWDLAFVGRKILPDTEEWFLEGSKTLMKVDYTYWALGYIISKEGARKLIEPKPLEKMVPVDEYIPIMYDRHPNTTWANQFPIRNLKAVGASPRLLYPTHYTGQHGYISDTEHTNIIQVWL